MCGIEISATGAAEEILSEKLNGNLNILDMADVEINIRYLILSKIICVQQCELGSQLPYSRGFQYVRFNSLK